MQRYKDIYIKCHIENLIHPFVIKEFNVPSVLFFMNHQRTIVCALIRVSFSYSIPACHIFYRHLYFSFIFLPGIYFENEKPGLLSMNKILSVTLNTGTLQLLKLKLLGKRVAKIILCRWCEMRGFKIIVS